MVIIAIASSFGTQIIYKNSRPCFQAGDPSNKDKIHGPALLSGQGYEFPDLPAKTFTIQPQPEAEV